MIQQSYIALTIGPIYKTLANAKKPKELFSSSYIFSYIMREIISKFRDREFITPYIKDDSIFDRKSEVGLFHDRFIFESKENDMDRVKSTIDGVIEDIAEKLDIDKSAVESYLQLNYGEYHIDRDKNPILEITPYLDTKELFYQITQDSSFADALRRKKGDRDNFLTHGKKIVDDLKRLCYKKYFCIVHADGDNMSRAIADRDNIEAVSKNLFEYAKESNRKIKEFGGQTIFAGGDDLLFFAPVMYEDKSIFNLCEEISHDFEMKFKGVATLSFGISIQYIKHPLYEAVETSRNLLFGRAKNEYKNNIAFSVTKHSGQTFETIIHKGNREIYKLFLKLTSHIEDGDGVDNFLHSLHHKIDTHKTTLELISDSEERLTNFFDNYFNKDIHKEYKAFFELLVEYIHRVYQDDKIEKDEKLNIIYATLRFVKFVKGDKQ